MKEQYDDINRINVQELINRAQELAADTAINYFNLNPSKVVKKIKTVLDWAGYSVEIYDYASQQAALYKINGDMSQLEQRIDRLTRSLEEAHRYRNEINSAYNDSQNKRSVIDTVMRQLDELERDLDRLENKKRDLEGELQHANMFNRGTIQNDIFRVDSDISSKIQQINNKRTEVDQLNDDINSLKGKYYNMFWY